MRMCTRGLVALVAGLSMVAAGCGDDVDTGADSTGDQPTVVVTTNILGDVVGNLAGGELDVVTIMPVGADPHEFQASAQQVAEIDDADVLVVNGGGFEEGLVDVIESAEADGVPTFEAVGAVETIEFADGDEADGENNDGQEEGGQEEGHGHEGVDPHFFTDPARMALVADALAEFLIANVDGIDADALDANAQAYVDELDALDTEVAETLVAIPEERRVLVTNHEVFAYFADRYDFEVVGAVVPSGSTADGASADDLAKLAETIEREAVPAIFADTSSSDELAQTLADEVGEVEVVELFSESLGVDGSEGDTYLDMIRTNAVRIAGALAAREAG